MDQEVRNNLKLKALARNKILPLAVRTSALDTMKLHAAAMAAGHPSGGAQAAFGGPEGTEASFGPGTKLKGGGMGPLGGSFTRIKNMCTHTGRSRGVIKRFGVSRLVFKALAEAGLVTGVRRAS